MLTSPSRYADPAIPCGPTDSIVDVPGVLVGNYGPEGAGRGNTAVLTPAGADGGVSVRGSNVATIQIDSLKPTAIDVLVHGVSLSGGSQFGLAAARGVAEWLRERGHGFVRDNQVLPLVPGAVIYDLAVANPNMLPIMEWGYQAAAAASNKPFARGNAGAGIGGTAGKGPGCVRVKGGLGTASLALPGGIVVGALVVLNALGGPINPLTGHLYATHGGFDIPHLFLAPREMAPAPLPDNTTLGVVATNCRLDREQLNKVADTANAGLVRAIRPMHAMRDGDTMFALSVGGEARGEVEVDYRFQLTDLICAAAADAMVRAVLDALFSVEVGLPGFPACRQLVNEAK